MTDTSKGPRVYGMADDAKRAPPPPEGLRGEAAPQPEDESYRRAVPLSDGHTVEVIESSGVAYAEAVADVGTPASEPAGTSTGSARPATMLPWLLLGLVLGWAAARRRPAETVDEYVPDYR